MDLAPGERMMREDLPRPQQAVVLVRLEPDERAPGRGYGIDRGKFAAACTPFSGPSCARLRLVAAATRAAAGAAFAPSPTAAAVRSTDRRDIPVFSSITSTPFPVLRMSEEGISRDGVGPGRIM
jgi:hypothetical protein